MTKRMLLLAGIVAGALLTVSAPMVAYADRDDRRSRGDLDVVATTSDGRLIEFESDDPRDADTIGKISGLVQDTRLVGIDYRPATGELIGLGDQGGVYAVSDRTARATLKSRLNVALSGASFGVDFNPTVDRLRIASDTGQNLRVNVDTGATLVDGALSYAPPAAATGIAGAAYTNNDVDLNTATTLFDLDGALDQIAVQSPANSGQLAPTGKLGVDTGPAIGFDIWSDTRRGTTTRVRAFASLTVDGRARWFRVNLLQGSASLVDTFSAKNQVTGIAIELDES
jgi:Domain of unknown function (DUF4394)